MGLSKLFRTGNTAAVPRTQAPAAKPAAKPAEAAKAERRGWQPKAGAKPAPAAAAAVAPKPPISAQKQASALASLNMVEGAYNSYKASSQAVANYDTMIKASTATAAAGALAGVLGAAVRSGAGDRGGGSGAGFGVASAGVRNANNIANSAGYQQAKASMLSSQLALTDAIVQAMPALNAVSTEYGVKLTDPIAKSDFKALGTALGAIRADVKSFPIG